MLLLFVVRAMDTIQTECSSMLTAGGTSRWFSVSVTTRKKEIEVPWLQDLRVLIPKFCHFENQSYRFHDKH